MLNPLSIRIGQKISGKEINDWCLDQINNHGSHYKDAAFLLTKHYNNDTIYIKTYKVETSGSDKPHIIIFKKCN